MRCLLSRTPGFPTLLAAVLLVSRPLPQLHAQETSTARQIADLEKGLAEPPKKLAEKATSVKPRPIDLDDIPRWRSARGGELSNDGQWFACRIGPAEGDGEVFVRQTRGDKEYKFPVGGPGGGGGPGESGGFGFGGSVTFSHDSKWCAFIASPPAPPKVPGFLSTTARRPRQRVVLVNLTTGEKAEIEGVRRLAFNGEAATWIALQRTPAEPPTPGGPPSPSPVAAGNDLTLRELVTGAELTLGNVGDWAFDKKGKWLALTIDTRDQAGNGVQFRDMTTAALVPLDSAEASYTSLAWTDKGDALTVLKGVDDPRYEGKIYSVLGFKGFSSGKPQKIVFDPRDDAAFPRDMTVSPGRRAAWTEDLNSLVFDTQGVKPKAEPEKDGEGRAQERPDLVIWHWRDEKLQSQQQVEAASDRTISYLSVYHTDDKKFVRLADEKLRTATTATKEKWAIAIDTRPYQRMNTLEGESYRDVYVIDLRTGRRRLALPKVRWFDSVSPDGTHLLYYENGHFHTQELATGKGHNITANVPASFVNTSFDRDVDLPPISPIGWSKDGANVLLSDGWDVWQVPARGGPGKNLTLDGKKEGIRCRGAVQFLSDPDVRGIDLEQPIYVTMLGEWTKKGGIGRVEPGKPGVNRLVWDDAAFGALQKARDADVFVYTRETWKDGPDYYAADGAFSYHKRLTDAMPRQKDFTWSSGVKIIDYRTTKGERLQGVLFLPADYEEGRRYPTVMDIYEKHSHNANRYVVPTANGFNKSVYTSNGYAVLMPDIRFRDNDPGVSSKECVLAALEAAVATGVVDRERVGLHGGSWGGYQTAFIITQTDAFKAAVAEAAMTNLVSMYGSIYRFTGSSMQPILESGAGRFTSGHWDNIDAYVRNSPVYHAKNVKTPLLLVHNDKDGAVDWNQGIEYFNTLRRLEKPVVMLQYKGEGHDLAKRANREDYSVRLRQFFDHYLLGAPAPGWLKEGVPHRERDEHLEERGE
jgi:dipeptidyl aminopeptidase/acylaminoacyl peptidase